eukprot:gnl/Spiro4/26700_TR13264_c0_g1_i1.p1 gnl/Spiro4/26700_TR13264_c0_g1~~gnl/Spiro4/26700_TR13264_c0_g1_i1.p1  ORF type:complete len:286 (-),score=82.61 gnl/Spiro4/26700_TR13264_c0_g1_i1:197-1054(-)
MTLHSSRQQETQVDSLVQSSGPLSQPDLFRPSLFRGAIGIVACSAEGAALCYRIIVRDAARVLARHRPTTDTAAPSPLPKHHPSVSMHSLSLFDYMEAIEAGDWNAVARLMVHSANACIAAGATVLICPDNTIHQALACARTVPRFPATTPWLSIVDAVVAEAQRRSLRRVLLLGTKWLVNCDALYPAAFEAAGIACVRTSTAHRERVSDIIMADLCIGKFEPACVSEIVDIIQHHVAHDGCDAVALCCTELPLILHDGNCPVPTLSSTELLAVAALEHVCRREQ